MTCGTPGWGIAMGCWVCAPLERPGPDEQQAGEDEWQSDHVFHGTSSRGRLVCEEQSASERIRRRTMIVVSNIAGPPDNPAGTNLGRVRSTDYASGETAPEAVLLRTSGVAFDHLRAQRPACRRSREALVTAGCHWSQPFDAAQPRSIAPELLAAVCLRDYRLLMFTEARNRLQSAPACGPSRRNARRFRIAVSGGSAAILLRCRCECARVWCSRSPRPCVRAREQYQPRHRAHHREPC